MADNQTVPDKGLYKSKSGFFKTDEFCAARRDLPL